MLQAGQRSNPVVYAETVALDGVGIPTDEDLLKMFRGPGYGLQTWARSVDAAGKTIIVDDPHWIAVRRQTPLHTDPKYPRYSHHLKVRVDAGIAVRGLDRVETPLYRGLYYVLDTHSPHQVTLTAGWNVAASIDHPTVLDAPTTIARLLTFARTRPFVTDADVTLATATALSRRRTITAAAATTMSPPVAPDPATLPALPRILLQTVPGSEWTAYLCARIPQLEVITDSTGNALDTFLAVLRAAGRDAIVRIEDDIILTREFLPKLAAVIAAHPRHVIQCFSMRQADLTEGSRWDRAYMMNQCVYLPPGYAQAVALFAAGWRVERERGWDDAMRAKTRGGTDSLLRDFLKARKEAYWLSVPSLVQHRDTKSRLGARSSRRQSPTFVDPDVDDAAAAGDDTGTEARA